MAINLGTGAIDKLYLGATEITKAYLGATEIYSAGGVTNDAFELTVETTAANETFLLPMQSVTSIDIDWGDGTVDTGITTDDPTHVYATAGTYAISVTGTARRLSFSQNSNTQQQVRTVTNFGDLGWQGDFSWRENFAFCPNLTQFYFGDCNTSNIDGMIQFFRRCTSLEIIDASNVDTSNVKSMFRMFNGCSSLTDVIGVENFNIEGLNNASQSLDAFMSQFALPTSRYDALLVNWESQNIISDLVVNFGNSKYSAHSAAAVARESLISTYGWDITDGGPA